MAQALKNTGRPTAQNAVGTIPRTPAIQTTSAKASEFIAANSIVHFWNDGSGTARVRNADASTPLKPARGYITQAVNPGGVATIYLPGSVITGMKGLVPGADYFLAAVPGQLTTSPPPNAQYVGTAALDGTHLTFNPSASAAVSPSPPAPPSPPSPPFVLTAAEIIAALGYTPQPVGVAPAIIQNGTAGAALNAGQAVSFTAGGVVPASAAGYTLPCHGFVLANAASGVPCSVYLLGQLIPLPGLVLGADYWLSATTAGALATSAPIGAGQLQQSIGFSPDGVNLMTRWDPGAQL